MIRKQYTIVLHILLVSKAALVMGLLFTVFSCSTAPTSTLKNGPFKSFNPDFIGVNGNLTGFHEPWSNDSLVAAVSKMGVKTVRYPGGTIGNYWDWDIGWIDQEVEDSLMIQWVVENELKNSKNRYTLENLAELYKKTGIKPVFMLNMLSKDLAHSKRNLKKADSLGLPIEYVELGNELYFDIPYPLLKYPTPEVYGDTCQKWIDTLKKEFPNAKFAIVGNYLKRHDRQIDWTKRVLSTCHNADAVTFHKYNPSGLDGSKERNKISAGSEGFADETTATRKAPKNIAKRQKWELEQLKDEKAFNNMLTNIQFSLESYKKTQIPKDLSGWSTEFNMRDDNSVILHSWSQTLLVSAYYLAFLERDVEITNIHNLIGPLFGVLHTNKTTFNHLKNEKRTSKPYQFSAGGLAVNLFSQAIQNASLGAPIEIDNNTFLRDDRNNTYDALQGWSFKSENGEVRTIVINYSDNGHTLKLPKNNSLINARSYYASVATPITEGFESIEQRDLKIGDENFLLPKKSITIVTYK
ncbi:hypothetical protein HX109_11745 [Galbibacter sp. BG1]|uniref:hypothetical protein n=1 Tax=Galbibacter sp. BG1 TaxID=1170699 RepID=UPI0015BEB267|nr:hypothetical protein [Galbibacter sp. BG1]QLE02195.1 hypothetical protein HX109_11745 [Galbibacter sp. BG1]